MVAEGDGLREVGNGMEVRTMTVRKQPATETDLDFLLDTLEERRLVADDVRSRYQKSIRPPEPKTRVQKEREALFGTDTSDGSEQ